MTQIENRPAEAARSFADATHFGNEISHGGFIIYRLVGISCEGIGSFALAKLLPTLDCQQSRPVIAELERIESGRVTWQEVLKNERRFARSQRRGSNPIRLLKALWEARRFAESVEGNHKKSIARLRLLMIESALRCYREEKGRTPERLEDLVPNYLHRVLMDPFTNQPLIYRPHGTNWLLYSVGIDEADDGGKPVGRGAASKGDFFLTRPDN